MNFIQKKRNLHTAKRKQELNDFYGLNGNLMRLDTENQRNGNGNSAQEIDNDHSFITVASGANTVANQSTVYIGLTSGRGHAQAEVGIACIDIESPIIKLIQLSDDLWYTGLLTKLNIMQPAQVIVPQTIYDAKPETADGKLMKYLREQFPMFNIIKIPRRHFSDTDGIELITKYCLQKYQHIKQSILTKYYALSAISGLLKYLEHFLHVNFKDNSLKLEFETKYGHMLIDVETSYKLELLTETNKLKNNHSSLYDLLDHCVTSIGKRTIRAKILEPTCDVSNILNIHQCIQELNSSEHIHLVPVLTAVLKNFNHVERLHKLALVVPQDDNIRAAEILINQTIHLKRCLQFVPVLRAKLEQLNCTIFKQIYEALADVRYQSILDHIDTVINKDLMTYHCDSNGQLYQRINCVQVGVDNMVDLMRTFYKTLVDEIQENISNLSTKCGQAFKMQYTPARGFHVRLMVSADTTASDFPDEFEVLELKRNTCTLTTVEINKLNIRLKSVIEEITLQSNVVIAFMLTGIVKEVDLIYDLSGFIATLDIILSMTIVSTYDGFVCPTFTDELRIVDGIHPLLERNIHRTVAVPNNIIGTPDFNIFILTGPNMSGKTVYIKMIALLQIMAQLGCYVPAKCAQFRIADRIFTRLGLNDSIEKNASTFVLEVYAMEHIIRNVTPNSLVIIDELCRSTNPKEGAQLAWSLCEHLASMRGIANDGEYFNDCENDGESKNHQSISTRSSNLRNAKINVISAPFIYLTTHYHCLTQLSNWYFNVVNAEEMLTEDGERHLNYDHNIQEGLTTIESYGLALARTVRFPLTIVPRAMEIYNDIKNNENPHNTMCFKHPTRKCSTVSKRLAALNSISDKRMSDMNTKSSVVSMAISARTTKSIRIQNNRYFELEPSNRSTFTITTTSSNNEPSFKMDRILYNLFGDMSSSIRKCKSSSEQTDMSDASDNNDIVSDEIKNRALIECLTEFLNIQTDLFTEAVLKLGLNHDQSDIISLPSKTPKNIQIFEQSMLSRNSTISLPENETIASSSQRQSIKTNQVNSAFRLNIPISDKRCNTYKNNNKTNMLDESQPGSEIFFSQKSTSNFHSNGSESNSKPMSNSTWDFFEKIKTNPYDGNWLNDTSCITNESDERCEFGAESNRMQHSLDLQATLHDWERAFDRTFENEIVNNDFENLFDKDLSKHSNQSDMYMSGRLMSGELSTQPSNSKSRNSFQHDGTDVNNRYLQFSNNNSIQRYSGRLILNSAQPQSQVQASNFTNSGLFNLDNQRKWGSSNLSARTSNENGNISRRFDSRQVSATVTSPLQVMPISPVSFSLNDTLSENKPNQIVRRSLLPFQKSKLKDNKILNYQWNPKTKANTNVMNKKKEIREKPKLPQFAQSETFQRLNEFVWKEKMATKTNIVVDGVDQPKQLNEVIKSSINARRANVIDKNGPNSDNQREMEAAPFTTNSNKTENTHSDTWESIVLPPPPAFF